MIRKYLILALFASLTASCAHEVELDKSGSLTTPSEQYSSRTDAVAGRLAIKVSEELAAEIEGAVATKSSPAALLGTQVNIRSMERIFPNAGRFEERTRREGLHLWYNVEFDEDMPNTRAAYSLLDVEGVTFVEDRALPQLLVDGPLVPFTASKSEVTRSESDDAIFNDPRLYDQWHYKNSENFEGFVAGVDVNVEPLWRSGVTGDSSIIVGVVDGGADWSHPDLKDNLYINEAELNGTPNFDDDGNGWVDDVYGFNFVSNSTEIVPHDHGTHVSGTVAAVNNNGVGVAGIAGGDGTPNSGVKLLGCQIFEHATSGNGDVVGDGATAIKYSADTGAIISQNSWGYTTSEISEVDRVAIDYFIKYAGVDEDGNQVGAMKGGIVVFAAGNENVMYSNPGAVEGAVCVTALAPNGRRASYSNYGDWADIAAPGGGGSKDMWEPYEGGVLSTIPMNKYTDDNGEYVDCGFFSGTSMACPHVSGIIALYLARQIQLGKTDGLTPEMVKERLFSTTRTLVEMAPSDYTLLGRGLIDASRFVGISTSTEPSAVSDLAIADVHYTSIDLKWSAPANAKGYTIYYSQSSLEGIDVENLPQGVNVLDVSKITASDGFVTFSVSDLSPSVKYYFAVSSWDYDDHSSVLSSQISATTEANQAPIFYRDNVAVSTDSVSLTPEQTLKYIYKINDPDGDAIIYTYVAGSAGESAMYNENSQTLTLFLTGSKVKEGSYTARFEAADIYGGKAQLEVNYEVVANKVPELVQSIDNITFNAVNKSRSISLSRYFNDPDSDQALTFSATSSDKTVAQCEMKDATTLLIKSIGYGSSTITVVATDVQGDKVETTFLAICGNDSSYTITLYPNPVKTTLNIKSEALSLEKLTIYNANGVELLSTTNLDERRVDVSLLPSGVYSVDVVVAGKSNISNITKL